MCPTNTGRELLSARRRWQGPSTKIRRWGMVSSCLHGGPTLCILWGWQVAVGLRVFREKEEIIRAGADLVSPLPEFKPHGTLLSSFMRCSVRPYQIRYGDRGHEFVAQFGIHGSLPRASAQSFLVSAGSMMTNARLIGHGWLTRTATLQLKDA
jgi:hypothetical protein